MNNRKRWMGKLIGGVAVFIGVINGAPQFIQNAGSLWELLQAFLHPVENKTDAAVLEKTFKNGKIEVTRFKEGAEEVYIGRDIEANEEIKMIRTPNREFHNCGHVYTIIRENDRELVVQVTFPASRNKSPKIVNLSRQY